MLVPQMPDLPMKQPGQAQSKSAPLGPKKLKRAKQPASHTQRSALARRNVKNASRDQDGKFARKGFFTHVFDGIEKLVVGVKKTHRKVKKVTRTVKRAFKNQPRQVTTPQRRKRTRRTTTPRTTAQTQRKRVPGYRGSVIRHLFGL